MTDFLEMAMADIDDVFFQEFVEQHGFKSYRCTVCGF